MVRRIPAFQQAAVCLTKFGPESGETAEEILARKDLERRSGVDAHKNEFWWGVGERGTAQSIQTLISQHGGNTVLFSAIKDQKPPNKGSAADALVAFDRLLGALAFTPRFYEPDQGYDRFSLAVGFTEK